MNSSQARQWFDTLQGHAGSELPRQDWLQASQQQARNALSTLPVPYRDQEAWRYTSIDSLLKHEFHPSREPFTALHEQDVQEWFVPGLDSYRLVFANGRFVPGLSDLADLPQGVRVGSLGAALSTDPQLLAAWFDQALEHHPHLFSALNALLSNDGLLVHIAPQVKLERPLQVLHLNLGLEQAILASPRNLIVLEAGSQATLLEQFVSTGQSVYFTNSLTEVLLQDSAQLTHYRIQEESRNAYHLSALFIAQQANSHYRSTTLAGGGAWARTDYTVKFREPGASCQVDGLYTVGDQQLIDFHLDIRHAVPGCSSQENFKGILYGKGRGVFDGRILVDKAAQKTDAHLHNANLLLTRNAEVDTKPQLEIHADDVKCSHGTSVGQLEPEQIFYLRSRGLDSATAYRLLCLGFAGEIVDELEIEPLRRHVLNGLQDKLAGVTAQLGQAGADA